MKIPIAAVYDADPPNIELFFDRPVDVSALEPLAFILLDGCLVTIGPHKPRREKRKCDPKLIATAREFRDRYLEAVNGDDPVLLPRGKYDVARALSESAQPLQNVLPEQRLLPQAA